MPDSLFAIVVLTVIGVVGYMWYHDETLPSLIKRSGYEEGSLLTSYDLAESTGLISLKKGKLANFDYNLMTNSKGRVMVLIDVPYVQKVHIVAFGDRSGFGSLVQKRSVSKFLSKVDLEGDFPSYFHMFTDKGQESTAFEIFDPHEMAYLVDFCRSYNLELYNGSMYITQSSDAKNTADNTTLLQNVEYLLQKNIRYLAGPKDDK